MSKFRKRKQSNEIRFHIAMILVESMGFFEAEQLAKRIYVDVVAAAIEEERKMWEELNRAKESGLT